MTVSKKDPRLVISTFDVPCYHCGAAIGEKCKGTLQATGHNARFNLHVLVRSKISRSSSGPTK